MNYFDKRRALKRSIQESYARSDMLEERIIKYIALNKQAYQKKEYEIANHYAKMIEYGKGLKEMDIELRQMYIKRIKKLID